MLNPTDEIKIFSGRANPSLAEEICSYLEIRPGRAHSETFPDGELFVKLHEDVRGRDVFVLQSTCRPVNEHVMELLIFIDCLRRASARRITAVLPYFGYARQDRKDEGRVPITAKLVSNLITQAGAHRVLTMDLHAAQIQGFFDIPVDHLEAEPVLSKHFRTLDPKNLVPSARMSATSSAPAAMPSAWAANSPSSTSAASAAAPPWSTTSSATSRARTSS
jgi:ribose-phosphate pyrophosphokinase